MAKGLIWGIALVTLAPLCGCSFEFQRPMEAGGAGGVAGAAPRGGHAQAGASEAGANGETQIPDPSEAAGSTALDEAGGSAGSETETAEAGQPGAGGAAHAGGRGGGASGGASGGLSGGGSGGATAHGGSAGQGGSPAGGSGGTVSAGGSTAQGGAEPTAGASGAPAPACVCSTGECCDGCYARPSTYLVGTHEVHTTHCVGEAPWVYLAQQFGDRYCDGTSFSAGTRWVDTDHKTIDCRLQAYKGLGPWCYEPYGSGPPITPYCGP